MSDVPDEVGRLVEAIESDGDTEVAWNRLHRVVHQLVRRVVEHSQWGDAATRDEVIQASVTRILTAPTLKTLTTKGALFAFSRIVALNEVRRAIKARTRTQRLSSLDQVDPLALTQDTNVATTVELGELVERSMAAVSDLDRQILQGVIEGYTAAEIGERLGLSTVNVGVRLHRVRVLLRAQILSQYFR